MEANSSPDDEMEPPAKVVPPSRDVNYDLLGEGIISWVGFVAFFTCLTQHWFAALFVLVISCVCGVHAFRSAPLNSFARIHALIGLTLWILFFAALLLLPLLMRL